jgi:hypothetical protein
MGRTKGSKNRPKDPNAAPAEKRRKGGGPVSITSMRSKPEPRTGSAPDANGAIPTTFETPDGPKVRIPFENGKRYMLDLHVPASDAELAVAARDMTVQIDAQKAELEKRREFNAESKERLSGIHDRLNELSESVKTKTKKVPVEVSEWVLMETGEIQVIRSDTGVVVDTRAAEASDVQMGLGLPTAPTTKPAVASDEDHVTVGDETLDDEDEGDEGDEPDDGEFNPSLGLATEPEPEGEHDITPTIGLLDAAKVAADAQAEEEGA